MFKCAITGRISRPGEKMNKVVVETRDRRYFEMRKNEETMIWERVEVGRGWEIVKEISVSDEGLKSLNECVAE